MRPTAYRTERKPVPLASGRVSVIIPLYNHASYIAEAVESVLAQGDIVGEMIVIDDGSKDESAAVMRRLAHIDSRIRFETQENQGAHATINRGLRIARGEYLAILNSDDAYEVGRLSQLVRALDIDEGSAIACSSIAFMDSTGKTIKNPWFDDALENYKKVRDLGVAIMDANFAMTTSNFLLRRSLIEIIGGFAPLRYAHDMEFLLRFAALGNRLAFVDKKLLRYRFHATNTIREDHRRVRLDWAICAAFFIHLVWQHGCSEDRTRRLVVEAVLDRHELRRAVDLCLPRLARSGATNLEVSGVLEDPLLCQQMMDVL